MSAVGQRHNWTDAYDAQMGLWRWYRTTAGERFLMAHAEANVDGMKHQKTRELILEMYASEEWRLLHCDPIYVSEGMCDVIQAASESFSPEPLLETDIMTTRGFLYFANPMPIKTKHGDDSDVAAASWTRLFSLKAHKDEAERIQAEVDSILGTDRPEDLTPGKAEEMLDQVQGLEAAGLSLTLYCSSHSQFDRQPGFREGMGSPALIPLHLTPWYFGMTFDGNEWDLLGKPSGAEWWWRVMQTTFRLMQQRIAVKHIERPDRPRRREAKRYGVDDLDVVVVRLRREQSEAKEPTGEEANYSHRFIVGGHWRNQWYPSESIHRQIWISPYVKGPEDKPLIVKPRRVYTWDR